MKALIQTITAISTQAYILFIFLFDPSEYGLGYKLVDNVPTWVPDIVPLAGNVLWILGCIFLISAIALTMVSTENLIKECKTYLEQLAGTFWGQISTMLRVLSTLIGIFGIASGFWFTGTAVAWLAIAISPWYAQMLLQIQQQEGDSER